jgi:hypothetical protein
MALMAINARMANTLFPDEGHPWARFGQKHIRIFAPLIEKYSSTTRTCLGVYMNRIHCLFDSLKHPISKYIAYICENTK